MAAGVLAQLKSLRGTLARAEKHAKGLAERVRKAEAAAKKKTAKKPAKKPSKRKRKK